ncbi:hypothetical protein K488DRAFT_25110, partial [Vararia minispora EC-137]
TVTAAAASYTGAAAYDPKTLIAPAPPVPPIATSVPVQLTNGRTNGLSMPQKGSFFGFSIEMSVAQQVVGKNSTLLQVPFLNLMSNIVARAGSVNVRVGGNTQEAAVLVPSLVNNTIIAKDTSIPGTPRIQYTSDLLYMMANVSQLVNVWWYLGIPFYNTTPFDLSIAQEAEAILGDRLLALQAGNEPDLYALHGHRPLGYSPASYLTDFDNLITQVASDASIPRQQNLWLVASSETGQSNLSPWNLTQVWGTGIVDKYIVQVHALTVQRYFNHNCGAVLGQGVVVDPQTVIGTFLSHNNVLSFVNQYNTTVPVALQAGKPLLMYETNSVSCSGFVGISDSFVAALWGLDWALSLAASNFSGANFHIGGQNAYYNPFTPPPTNQTTFRQWSVGPIYYSALVVAEALGSSNQSQVVDLQLNNAADQTPGFAIYEKGAPTKLVLINYINDPTGAQAYTAQISIGGGTTGQPAANPSSVRVKRLSAASVTQKGNLTWAGQTFGNSFESDGRPMGNETVEQIPCDASTNTCSVKVNAPEAVLVFLTDTAFQSVESHSAVTFATSTQTVIVVPTSVLATSNGHSGF